MSIGVGADVAGSHRPSPRQRQERSDAAVLDYSEEWTEQTIIIADHIHAGRYDVIEGVAAVRGLRSFFKHHTEKPS